MCMNERRYCECGRNSAFLTFRDNLLPPEILVTLYCPQCRPADVWDEATMLADCGWVLEYDVERAQSLFRPAGDQGAGHPGFHV